MAAPFPIEPARNSLPGLRQLDERGPQRGPASEEMKEQMEPHRQSQRSSAWEKRQKSSFLVERVARPRRSERLLT